MNSGFDSLTLYDSDIITQIHGVPDFFILEDRLPPDDQQGCFTGLQEPELIFALYQLNYPAAYSRLRKLTCLLPPKDAMVACLCALSGTDRLLNTVLDHCPPIPEFQFQGVGRVPSLLAAAARYDKHQALDILLRRGADPSRGPAGLESPLEAAFTSYSLFALERLLKIPDLEVSLTPPILETWGGLQENDPNPLRAWCCKQLADRLWGETPIPFAPTPIPPQLRLGHALRSCNPQLAAQLCQERPITDAEVEDAKVFFHASDAFAILSKNTRPVLPKPQKDCLCFLLSFLAARPDTLEEPEIRSAVVEMTLALPEEDAELARWVERLADGPVFLRELPHTDNFFINPLSFLFGPEPDDIRTLSDLWSQRLGTRLIPALNRGALLPLSRLAQEDVRFVLERSSFIGEVSPDLLSPAAGSALEDAPTDLLPRLLQPGGLLAEESPQQLLDACHVLPPDRRNAILPFIRKETRYAL